ncbi:hypothetical protein GCM10009547_33390 [Sporichthya brevicatena]|uniref:Uncharacterized protein n=1 Tax=Sporichthya brevicatena TaxID=171442 RepID=A0ABN1H2J1_9ACTN
MGTQTTRRTHRHRYLAVGATAVVGFVALGLALPDNTPDPRLMPDPADRTQAPLTDPLQATAPWRAFPVGAAQRPLLVFDPVTIPTALRSDPDRLRGRWVLPDRLTTSPPRLDGFGVTSAEEAVAMLRRALAGVFRDEQLRTADPSAEPVTVSAIRLTRRTFDTDRGRRTLPAWAITFGPRMVAPAIVLAVTDDALYPSPVPTDAEGDVTLSPDGRRLTYSFLGAASGQGNCRADYTPVFLETATAVAIGAVEHRKGHSRQANCRMSAYRRSVSVTLTAPLHNRVVVTYAYGAPLPVRPDGTYRWYRPATGTGR